MNHIDAGLMKAIIDPVINHANKQGEDIRYEPEFEQVESEILKLTSIHKENKPDLQFIIKQSTDLLTNKAKDLRLLCWLLFSYLKIDFIGNIYPVSELLCDFLKRYHDDLFPRKIRQQLAVLIWFVEHLDIENQTELESQTSEWIQTLKTQLEALNEQCNELFNDDAPNIRATIQFLSHIQARAKAEQQRQQESSTPEQLTPQLQASSAAISTLAPVSVTNVVNEADFLRVARSIQDGVRPLMQSYLQKGNRSPVPH